MAIKPNGFQFSSGPIDQDGGTIQGGVRATKEEARASLVQACEEFIRSATKETTMEYVYGDGENQYVTRAPVPEPLEGYTVVVSQGMDHHGCEDEDFYAIPQGTTLVPRKDGVYLDHLHIKLQGEIIWVHFWEVAEVVFPSGSMELRQTEKGAPAGWVSLPNWREEQADS